MNISGIQIQGSKERERGEVRRGEGMEGEKRGIF